MALRKCKECGHYVSSKAKKCPNCGAPIKKRIGCISLIGIAFIVFIVLIVIGQMLYDESDFNKAEQPSNSIEKTEKTKESTESQVAKKKEDDKLRKELEVEASLKKIEPYIASLRNNGTLKKFDVESNEAYVDPVIWHATNIVTKEGIAFVLAEYCNLKGSSGRITIYDYYRGNKLAKYGSLGFKVY